MTGHQEACDTGIYPYITFSGCRTTMWSPRWVLLLLALVLIPDPGVSQIGAQHKNRCHDCPAIKDTEDPNMLQYVIDGKVEERYLKCPLSIHIRLQLNNKKKEVICAEKSLPWVKKIMECLDGDKKCLQDTSSNSQKEFSKGSNEKPSTTTVKAPTTATLKPSTQTWDHNIGQSTEPTEAGAATPTASLLATKHSDIIPLNSNKTKNSQQGDNKSSQDPIVENLGGKMKHMQTAIISLIAIVLVMVAVGVGLYCQKKKKKELNSPCNPIGYRAAPSEDSLVEVRAE